MSEGKIGTPLELIAWLTAQPEKRYEIKEYHEKRSLSANAYAWALIGKIADVMRKSKEEVYLQMLKDYGQSEIISVKAYIKISGYFKYYEEEGRGYVNGREFIHYKIYKGSSEMDVKEMSHFIDGIVFEAKQLGIETMTPDELLDLKARWGDEINSSK